MTLLGRLHCVLSPVPRTGPLLRNHLWDQKPWASAHGLTFSQRACSATALPTLKVNLPGAQRSFPKVLQVGGSPRRHQKRHRKRHLSSSNKPPRWTMSSDPSVPRSPMTSYPNIRNSTGYTWIYYNNSHRSNRNIPQQYHSELSMPPWLQKHAAQQVQNGTTGKTCRICWFNWSHVVTCRHRVTGRCFQATWMKSGHPGGSGCCSKFLRSSKPSASPQCDPTHNFVMVGFQ